jgi:nucleoside-diphosphate-sugar epimerase
LKTILVTGATGLVGSHLLPLFGPDQEIHILSRQAPPEAAAGNVVHHQLDLGGEFDPAVLPERVDGVVYLAQSDHFRDFPERALDIFEVNVASPLRLLDYARRAGARAFVSASSGGVYGSGERGLSEDHFIPASGNLGFYLSTKLCGEILAENYAPYMNVALLRLFFAYGRGQKRSMLVPRLVDNIRAGNPINLQGRDGIRINPVHAGDAARAVRAALDLEGCARINVAGPDTVSIREIGEIIGAKVGRAPVFAVDETQVGQNLIGDIDKMSALLVAPERRFEDGVTELF